MKNIQPVTWSRIALLSCIIASAGDMIALLIFARIYPGYDPSLQPISALGALGSPIAHMVSLWWIFMGSILLLFAFAYGSSNFFQNQAHRFAAWMIGIYAAGEEIGSGVFPGNHIAGHLTGIGIVHNVIGGIGVLALVISPFVLMKKYTRECDYLFNRFLLGISISGIFVFILFSISKLAFPALNWLHSWHGLWQRIFVANYYVYLLVIAVKVFLEGRSRQHPELN